MKSIVPLLKKSRFLVNRVRAFRKFRKQYRGVNWIKTIYVNFRTQKLGVALKLPIFIYGKVKILSLMGKLCIEGRPIRRRTILLGYNTDMFSASKRSALLNITPTGKVTFQGFFSASVDYTLDVAGDLTFGNYCAIGNGVKVRCWHKMTIGKGLRCGVEAQLFDTNFHYMRNIENGKIYPNSKEVVIGKYCWIGNRATVMKGTVLSDYSVVAGNSLLNKDYTTDRVAPLLAGTPAKMIGSGNVRIFDTETEGTLNNFFKVNSEMEYYQGAEGLPVNEGIDKILYKFFSEL